MALLKVAYNAAIKWGEITENPVKALKFYSEKQNRRIRYLTDQEKAILLSGTARHPLLQKLIVFALRTGMRRGEILDLKWASVDLKKGIIAIERSKGGDKRYIPIHSDVYDILNTLSQDEEFVFCYNDSRIKEDSFKNAFRRAIARLGIKNFHFHDLRHSYAADYLAMGGTLKGLQELLGHASIVMTM